MDVFLKSPSTQFFLLHFCRVEKSWNSVHQGFHQVGSDWVTQGVQVFIVDFDKKAFSSPQWVKNAFHCLQCLSLSVMPILISQKHICSLIFTKRRQVSIEDFGISFDESGRYVPTFCRPKYFHRVFFYDKEENLKISRDVYFIGNKVSR